MFKTLYLLAYNNYFNRTIKVEESLGIYLENDATVYPNINFNPNDEITTEQILNVDEGITFDYLLVVDDTNTIESRWFVIEKVRVREGQWKLTLRRDVIADYYNIIQNAPCLIEKATLEADSPLIFNKEDMTFNQIKSAETLLKDKCGCAWLVGYYARDAIEMNGTVAVNPDGSSPYIPIDSPINAWKFYKYSNLSEDEEEFIAPATTFKYKIKIRNLEGSSGWNAYLNYADGAVSSSTANSNRNASLTAGYSDFNIVKRGLQNGIDTIGIANLNAVAPNYIEQNTAADYNELLSLNGSTIRDTNGEIYYVDVVPEDTINNEFDVPSGSLFNLMSQVITASTIPDVVSPPIFGTPNTKSFSIVTEEVKTYSITLTRQAAKEVTYDMNSAKLITTDAPYNIFAIPYGQITVLNRLNNTVISLTDKDVAMATAMAIQKQQSSKVYDIQLLPYCPIIDLVDGANVISVTDPLQYSVVKDGDEHNLTVIFNVPSARFTFDILNPIAAATTAIEKKVNNECDKWRICSPNYANYFDFSVEMNGGVKYFNVDCEYKPFTPYIHINPNFGGLYGRDFNDPRGLICGGDFSLARVKDQWEEYQIQNKNFQSIFDRQIQNMEYTHKYQKRADIFGAIAGTLQGATSGAMLGAMSGKNMGWGIVGGMAASGLGGIADININQKLRSEALDYTQDLFTYQLGNIQALPDTLGKVSAFNNNNKVFPVLEFYTATDIEKEALRNKIKYNGMTVNVIGEISNYLQIEPSYIKAKLIRIPYAAEDTHVFNVIAEELNMGVYIQEE